MKPPRPPAPAHPRLARSTFGLLLVASAVAVLGPFVSYRADLAEVSRLVERRVEHEAALYAEVTADRLVRLEHELERLAARPELDPRDGPQALERQLLGFAHENSAQFNRGLAMIDLAGEPVWSDPPELLAEVKGLAKRPWFQRILTQRAGVDALGPGDHRCVVAVPMVRDGLVAGAVVGLLDLNAAFLPHGDTPDRFELLLEDDSGDVLLPDEAPDWSKVPGFPAQVASLQDRPVGELGPGPSGALFAAVRSVGRTGLRLVLVADEGAVSTSMRRRFLTQMVVIALVQAVAAALLALLFRRLTRRAMDDERDAAEAERLLTLGTASSLIAHEVKNALNGLKTATSLLAAEGAGGVGLRSIRGEVDRLAHLSASLLQFGRPANVQLQPTDVASLVAEVAEGLAVLPEREDAKVDLSLPPGALVLCDPLLLTTAVHNLLRNAVEATVAARDVGLIAEARVKVELRREPGTVAIRFEDNAGGVATKVLDRLFQPFVSGKAKGIGLGLTMSRRALEQQGGSLDYEPIEGGSRFVVRLPAREGT